MKTLKKTNMRFFIYVILFGFSLFVMACSRGLDFPEKEISFHSNYIINKAGKKVGFLKLSSFFTNKGSEELISTSMVYYIKQTFNFESQNLKGPAFVIIPGANVVIVSNRLLFSETMKGSPVSAFHIAASFFHRAKAYITLVRRRLGVMYKRYFGRHAPGREQFIDKQMRITHKSIMDGFPNHRYVWSFTNKTSFISGVEKGEKVTRKISFKEALVFPFKLRYLLRKMKQSGITNIKTKLVLPGIYEKNKKMRISIRFSTNTMSTRYNFFIKGQKNPFGELVMDQRFIPISARFYKWEFKKTK